VRLPVKRSSQRTQGGTIGQVGPFIAALRKSNAGLRRLSALGAASAGRSAAKGSVAPTRCWGACPDAFL
jgi:hypothetical protein